MELGGLVEVGEGGRELRGHGGEVRFGQVEARELGDLLDLFDVHAGVTHFGLRISDCGLKTA